MNSKTIEQFEELKGNPGQLKSAMEDYMLSLGVSPNDQYIAVLDYLCKNFTHPTCNEIFYSLNHSYPTLTKSRVNTILEILANAGAIKSITIDKHNIRYDGNTSPHAHFVCAGCGSIDNMFLSQDIKTAVLAPPGAFIYDFHILCTGVCHKCRGIVAN